MTPDEQQPDRNPDQGQDEPQRPHGDQPPPPSGEQQSLGHGFSSQGQQPPAEEPWTRQYGEQPQQDPYGQPGPYGQQAPYGHPGAPYQQQAYPGGAYPDPAQQQWGYAQPAPPTHSRATTAMVLGLVALVGSLFTCGLTFLAGPFAWWQGNRALAEIDESQGQLGGRDQARGGQIMGIIATVLLVLAVLAAVIFVVLLAIGLAAETGTSDGLVY